MNTLIVYDRKKNQGPAVIIGSIISMSAYAALKDEINDKAYGRLIVVADKDNFKETAKIRNRFAGKILSYVRCKRKQMREQTLKSVRMNELCR